MSMLGPILLSLRVATIATFISFVLGLGLARLFTVRTFPLRSLWEALILLPMVFPPIITGYLLLLLFGVRGLMGHALNTFGINIVFTWPAAVIASVAASLPLMYQSCKSALLGVNERCIDAARTLGLSEKIIFFKIVLPLAAPGILGGVALSFARALGEFGGTLIVAGNIPGRTQTVPLALYSAIEAGKEGEANFYLFVTVLLSFGLMSIVGYCQRITHRNSGRSGSPVRTRQ